MYGIIGRIMNRVISHRITPTTNFMNQYVSSTHFQTSRWPDTRIAGRAASGPSDPSAVVHNTGTGTSQRCAALGRGTPEETTDGGWEDKLGCKSGQKHDFTLDPPTRSMLQTKEFCFEIYMKLV